MNQIIFRILTAATLGNALLASAAYAADPACAAPASALLSIVRPSSTESAAIPDCPTLVGTWEVQVAPDGIPPFTAYNVFSADGNSTEFDNSNPPGAQTVAVGPWKRTGVRTFAFVEVNQIFDGEGAFAGTVRVKSSMTLDETGDKFTSSFTFSMVDPKGTVVFEGSGTATGVRLKV